MRIHHIAMPLLSLTVLMLTSVTYQAQEKSAEDLYKGGELDPVRGKAADSGPDTVKSYSRQGYGHVRQGNTSTESAKDPLGREHNPYGGETPEQLRIKFEDRLDNPAWRLGIKLEEPRRIVVTYPDGTSEEYWYVLFRVINDNMRAITDTTVKNYRPGNIEGGSEPVAVEVDTKVDATRMEGLPIQTTIVVTVETSTYDVHGTPRRQGLTVDDDLADALRKESERDVGKGLSEKTDATDTAKAETLAKKRYDYARRVYQDVADPYVMRAISEREDIREWRNGAWEHKGLMEWRDGKWESVLWPASAFKREIAPAHDIVGRGSDWLSGPRCLPAFRMIGDVASDAPATRYPAVYEDNSWAGYFGEGDAVPQGARIIKDPADPMWGKVTKMRYRAYDVVDRFGRVVVQGDPAYLAAKTGGGEIIKADAAHNIAGQLEQMIGQTAKRPPYRIYRPGDRMLVDWDTGTPRDDAPNQTWRICGLIVHDKDQEMHQQYVSERSNAVRSPNADQEIGLSMKRAADNNRFAAAVPLTADFEPSIGGHGFGRKPADPDSPVPVKVIDHLGRPVRSKLVTYEPGEKVTEAEYRIWAERYPKEVVAKYDAQPWTRPLKAEDFLVGLPKIKMGRAFDASRTQPETLKRGMGKVDAATGRTTDMQVADYRTGRLYDPKVIMPWDFYRDPDGSYYTYRKAPVPAGAALQPGEDYAYAPLGEAEDGAVPIPQFDRVGVWEDYVDPMTGMKMAMRDPSGALVRDQLDQIQYIKEYEYEWMYLYEFDPEPETDKRLLGEHSTDAKELKTVRTKVIMRGGQVTGLALPRIVMMVREMDYTSMEEVSRKVIKGLALGARTKESVEAGVAGEVDALRTQAKNNLKTFRDRTNERSSRTLDEVAGGFTGMAGLETLATDMAARTTFAEKYDLLLERLTDKVKDFRTTFDAAMKSVREVNSRAARLALLDDKVQEASDSPRPVVRAMRELMLMTLYKEQFIDKTPEPAVEFTVEEPETFLTEGESVQEIDMPEYLYNYLRDTIVPGSAGSKRMGAKQFVDRAPDKNQLDLTKTIRTYDRWTIPPPLVYVGESGKPEAQTRVQVRTGPATKADGSDAPRGHIHYISERWGAFVFRNMDRAWDYMTVEVRGLRPSFVRRGRKAEAFTVPSASAPDATAVNKIRHDTRWVREEWVYAARFERLGDEYETFRDLVRNVREYWYLRSETPVGD